MLDGLKIPTVPYLGQYQNLHELVEQQYDWMLQGKGEGIIITTQTQIFKWKIGAEEKHTNKESLEKMISKTDG